MNKISPDGIRICNLFYTLNHCAYLNEFLCFVTKSQNYKYDQLLSKNIKTVRGNCCSNLSILLLHDLIFVSNMMKTQYSPFHQTAMHGIQNCDPDIQNNEQHFIKCIKCCVL